MADRRTDTRTNEPPVPAAGFLEHAGVVHLLPAGCTLAEAWFAVKNGLPWTSPYIKMWSAWSAYGCTYDEDTMARLRGLAAASTVRPCASSSSSPSRAAEHGLELGGQL